MIWLAFLLSPATLGPAVQEGFSLGGAGCGDCRKQIERALETLPGPPSFTVSDRTLLVRVPHGVSNGRLLKTLAQAGIAASPLRQFNLATQGEAVGPLPGRVVPGAFTVFDVYADWCDPCQLVSDALGEVLRGRKDVYVRRLNVVSFESPLAEELHLEVLPHVEVFAPDGSRVVIEGADLAALGRALGGGP